MNKQERFKELKNFDMGFASSTSVCIAGVDEAGRGPLAGPVVAAAVILDYSAPSYYAEDSIIIELNDSKKLSESKRNILFEIIKQNAISIGIGICNEKIVDEINILQATFLAMKKAVDSLDITPNCLLIDGNKIIPSHYIGNEPFPAQNAIVKGDIKSLSIAAASIIAKVTRDRLMVEYDKEYPGYGFAKHKGYPTKAHYEAIERLGICEIHRRSFLGGFKNEK
jgi:ribonuclease HII